MNKKKKLPIIDWLEKHLGLMTAASSILAIGVTGLFKCITYWHEKGYYDFWRIPSRYMEINYYDLLMQFLLNFSGTVIIIGVGIIYINIYNSSKKFGRIILHVIPLFVNTTIIIYAMYRVGGTINDAFNFENHEVFKTFIGVQIILYILELFGIHSFKEKKYKNKKIQNAENEKTNLDTSKDNNEKNKQTINMEAKEDNAVIEAEPKRISFIQKRTAINLLFIIVYIIAVLNWACFLLYHDRKVKCEDTTRFEVIQDKNGQEYVILADYNGKCFIKPCTVYEKKHSVFINSDKYKLLDVGAMDVTIYEFRGYEKTTVLLNNKKYMALKNK